MTRLLQDPSERGDYDALVITYNHVEFIRKAIDSILSQSMLPRRLIIADHSSNDGTSKRCSEYAERFPNLVLHVVTERNSEVSLAPYLDNLWTGLGRCRSEYIALLDGDDFWIDTRKCEIQMEYMRKGASSVFGGANIVDREERLLRAPSMPSDRKVTTTQFIVRPENTNTSGMLIRRDSVPRDMPKYMHDMYSADVALKLMALTSGYGVKMFRVVASYRQHGGGIWSGKPMVERLRRSINDLTVLRKNRVVKGILPLAALNSVIVAKKARLVLMSNRW